MKRIYSLLILLFVSGCATVEPPAPKMDARQLTKADQIQVGMNKTEVAEIMGDYMITGYEISDDPVNRFKPVTINNPYRAEILRTDTKVFDIAFYYTTVKQADGIISDEELTPFVFQSDKFLGKGWNYLEQLKQENSL